MALTLIKEDGTGKIDSNAYANAADCDAYHEGHLYATAWVAATADQKDAALVMATRLIDSQIQFDGGKTNSLQSLQWPREGCHDPDGVRASSGAGSSELPANLVPKAVMDATCEMARELLITDRTAPAVGEGLKYFFDASSQIGYDKKDTRPVITHVAQAMLVKFGSPLKSRSGAVRLVRS